MIVYLALFALSILVLGQVAGPVLNRQDWVHRHPAPAITLWLSVLSGTIAAGAGFVALVVFGSPGPGHGVVEWFSQCVGSHSHPGAVVAAVLSLICLAASATAGRIAVRRLRATIAAGRRHREMLGLVVNTHDDLDDTCVLDHPVPVAYCLPSCERPIVVSTGALALLGPAQLAAVLEHERAHLRGRHHLVLTLVDALCGVVPRAATFRDARSALAQLLEQVADDAAARRHGRAAVSSALRCLVVTACPPGALAAGAGGSGLLEQRLERLEGQSRNVRGRGLAWVGASVSAALPVLIAASSVTVIILSC
jgi:Zn-dependent protease with chaperone function